MCLQNPVCVNGLHKTAYLHFTSFASATHKESPILRRVSLGLSHLCSLLRLLAWPLCNMQYVLSLRLCPCCLFCPLGWLVISQCDHAKHTVTCVPKARLRLAGLAGLAAISYGYEVQKVNRVTSPMCCFAPWTTEHLCLVPHQQSSCSFCSLHESRHMTLGLTEGSRQTPYYTLYFFCDNESLKMSHSQEPHFPVSLPLS